MMTTTNGRITKKKKKAQALKFGGSLHKLAKHSLGTMTIAKSAIDVLEDQGQWLVRKIVLASEEAQKGLFQNQTMNAAVLKAGLSLCLPEEACERAVLAGEKAVLKLIA